MGRFCPNCPALLAAASTRKRNACGGDTDRGADRGAEASASPRRSLRICSVIDWVKTDQRIVIEYYLVSRPEDPVMALKGGAVVILPAFSWKTQGGMFPRSNRYVLHSAAEVRKAVQDMIVDEARWESGEYEFPPNMDLVILQRCAEVIALVVQNETLPDEVEALNACLRALGILSLSIQQGKTLTPERVQPIRDALYREECKKALDLADGELFMRLGNQGMRSLGSLIISSRLWLNPPSS